MSLTKDFSNQAYITDEENNLNSNNIKQYQVDTCIEMSNLDQNKSDNRVKFNLDSTDTIQLNENSQNFNWTNDSTKQSSSNDDSDSDKDDPEQIDSVEQKKSNLINKFGHYIILFRIKLFDLYRKVIKKFN